MHNERQPFYYLDKSLNLLLVDDDPGVLSLVSGLLSSVGLYSVKVAQSALKARELLKKPERTHLCVFDLGLSDIDNDEFHLLRNYSSNVSFVVFTGSASPAKGWMAHELGARDILEKTPEFDLKCFLKKINRHALMTVINPAYGNSNDNLSYATQILFDKQPRNVSEWAMQIGITDRELRHIWRTHLGANAKIILSIHQIFSSAFAWYEKKAGNEDSISMRVPNSGAYTRLEDYYHMHRSAINDFISYGNITLAARA